MYHVEYAIRNHLSGESQVSLAENPIAHYILNPSRFILSHNVERVSASSKTQHTVDTMGCCSSSASQDTPQNQPVAKPQEPETGNGRNLEDHDNNKSTTETVNDDDGAFRVCQFDINDLDRQSLDSVRTGDSLIFPDHNDVEVLNYTPIRKKTFIKMEDTFWWKKRQLIPDYSVMEKIDKHVLAVGGCSLSRRIYM